MAAALTARNRCALRGQAWRRIRRRSMAARAAGSPDWPNRAALRFRHGVVAGGQVRELGQFARRVEGEKGAERSRGHNEGREGDACDPERQRVRAPCPLRVGTGIRPLGALWRDIRPRAGR